MVTRVLRNRGPSEHTSGGQSNPSEEQIRSVLAWLIENFESQIFIEQIDLAALDRSYNGAYSSGATWPANRLLGAQAVVRGYLEQQLAGFHASADNSLRNAIDAFAAAQNPPLSRADAVRTLVAEHLTALGLLPHR